MKNYLFMKTFAKLFSLFSVNGQAKILEGLFLWNSFFTWETYSRR